MIVREETFSASRNFNDASVERFYLVRIMRMMSPCDAVDLGRPCHSLFEFQVLYRYIFIVVWLYLKQCNLDLRIVYRWWHHISMLVMSQWPFQTIKNFYSFSATRGCRASEMSPATDSRKYNESDMWNCNLQLRSATNPKSVTWVIAVKRLQWVWNTRLQPSVNICLFSV